MSLENEELNKILSHASSIRKVSRRGVGPQAHRSLENIALTLLEDRKQKPKKHIGPPNGTVIWKGKDSCVVRSKNEDVVCNFPKGRSIGSIAVGDRIHYELNVDRMEVTDVFERETVLSRPDPDGRKELVIAANIDYVLIVMALIAPPLRQRMIDRYMVAVQRGGAKPILCLNKTDLLDESNRDEEMGKIAPYYHLMPVLMCSTSSNQGIDEIREFIAGKTCVLVGKSGVGKSSLVNAIGSSQTAATQEVSEMTNKGKHTTTASRMYELDNGAKIIDTPGVRAFGLPDMTPESLQWYFPEFEEYRDECRFRDCTHLIEPECAVREAADLGEINRHRYETYKRIAQSS